MKLNKIDEIWNSANSPFKWIFSLLSFKNFATMAMWRNDLLLLTNQGAERFYLLYHDKTLLNLWEKKKP